MAESIKNIRTAVTVPTCKQWAIQLVGSGCILCKLGAN